MQTEPVSRFTESTESVLTLEPTKINAILQPYWTKFVGASTLAIENETITLRSNLGVDKPWYCDSTGHMNAVELNLAFNQMMYIAIGHSIGCGYIPQLVDYDWAYFMKKYWPDFLITQIETQFKAPLLVDQFCATLRILKIKASAKHLWFSLDLTVAPGHNNFPEPLNITHAYAKMSLVIKDYRAL